MTKAAVKFLQAYFKSMMNVGNQDVSKAISIEMGTKLGKMYQKMNIIDFGKGLKEMYKVLKGKPKILKIDDKTYDITIKYKKPICPIGGIWNIKIAKEFQDSICIPYTLSFLTSFEPNCKFRGEIKKCILFNGTSFCKYKLHIEEKQ